MARSKSNRGCQRGTPKFERDYLLSMGYVKESMVVEAPPPSLGVSWEAVGRTHAACEWLHNIAVECEQRGNKNTPPGLSAWIQNLGILCYLDLVKGGIAPGLGDGGMGAVAPMSAQRSGAGAPGDGMN